MKITRWIKAVSMIMAIVVLWMVTNPHTVAASAGLYFGPTYMGNLKIYMTNPHYGYAGPKVGYVNHANFHVDKKAGAGYAPVGNFHVTKYQYVGSTSTCLYVWESQSGGTVVDQCWSSWSTAVSAAVSAIKAFVKTMLNNADWIAFVLISALVVWALVGLMSALAPVLALSSDPGQRELNAPTEVKSFPFAEDPIMYTMPDHLSEYGR